MPHSTSAHSVSQSTGSRRSKSAQRFVPPWLVLSTLHFHHLFPAPDVVHRIREWRVLIGLDKQQTARRLYAAPFVAKRVMRGRAKRFPERRASHLRHPSPAPVVLIEVPRPQPLRVDLDAGEAEGAEAALDLGVQGGRLEAGDVC